MRWYYVVNGGEVVGPVRTHYISRAKDKGIINGDTYVYNSKVVTDWTRYKHIATLIEDLVKKKNRVMRQERQRHRQRKRTRKYYRTKTAEKKSQQRRKEEFITEVSQADPIQQMQPAQFQKSQLDDVESEEESSSEFEETSADDTSMQDAGLTGEQRIVKHGDWIELLDGKVGRVLFMGAVDGMLGEMLGVELTTEEGECGGEFNGRTYFNCKQGHGKFINRHYIQRIISDPSLGNNHAHNPMQKVVDDLNLEFDFDLVGLQMACNSLELDYSTDEIQQAYNSFHSTCSLCSTAADQLEIIIQLLEEPCTSPDNAFMQNSWRRFSAINDIQ